MSWDGTGWSSMFHQSLPMTMVGGVSHAKIVAGGGDNVAIECGPVGVGEREFLDAQEDSDVARWIFDDDEEGRSLLLR